MSRVSLPFAAAGDAETARRRLGGRAESLPGVGRYVELDREDGGRDPGIVVFVDHDHQHVWLGNGRVRRTRASRPSDGAPPSPLGAIANSARAFCALEEGARVVFRDETNQIRGGTLREKCRYGALVLHDDGRLLAIGFSRIWREKGE